MKTLTKVLLLGLGMATFGGAYADSSRATVNNLNQSQSGTRNNQVLDIGIVDKQFGGTSRANVNASNIRQTQRGTRNRQTMKLGIIDKNLGSHQVRVTARNVTQSQSGTRNRQSLRVGVVE